MGASYALTGNDVITINSIPLNDFANNDIGTIELPNNLVEMATGKNNNTIFAFNPAGNNATLTVRVLMSSSDDKRLSGLVPEEKDFERTVLCTGSLLKRVGDGSGNVSVNMYALSGGIVQKKPQLKTATNGDTDQAVVEYVIIFAYANRIIT